MRSTSMLVLVVAGVGLLTVVGLIFRWLVSASRSPSGRERIVALFLALMVIEASVYEDPNAIPNGLFHPHAGSLSFRLWDVLVPLAVAAYFVARPPGRRSPMQAVFWCSFMIWIFVSGIEGLMGHNPKDLVTFEAKLIIYLGVLVLVAAVPVHRWLESRPLRRVIVMSSSIAALLLITTEAQVSINLNLPLLPLQGFGVLGTDAATIFATLGAITVAVAVCSERGRVRMLMVALPMLAAPFVSGQRAALAGLGAMLLVLAAAAFLARDRIRITAAEVGLFAAASVGAFAMLVLVSAVENHHLTIPLANEIQKTFSSRGKQLSGQDRLNQWDQAVTLISGRPWFGWGLGKAYAYYSPGFYEFVTTDLTHNIAVDLLLRTGVVGLALFLIAVGASLRDFALATRDQIDARVAALGTGCLAALVGLVVKGMFESIFEKYRLALLMGMLIGMSVSFTRERWRVTTAGQTVGSLQADRLVGVVAQ